MLRTSLSEISANGLNIFGNTSQYNLCWSCRDIESGQVLDIFASDIIGDYSLSGSTAFTALISHSESLKDCDCLLVFVKISSAGRRKILCLIACWSFISVAVTRMKIGE